MFDFDAGKLMIIAMVALVVIGPKDLPRVLRQLGQMVTRVRRMASEFQNQFMDAIKEADLQDLRTEVAKLKDSATLDVNFNPAHDIKTQLQDAINGPVSPSATAPGSTSELTAMNLPAASEVDRPALMTESGGGGEVALSIAEIEPVTSIASAGIGPTADVAMLDLPPPVPVTIEPSLSDEPTMPSRRKILIPKRRVVVSRFDPQAPRGLIPQRAKNILPARRETPEQ